MGARLIADTTGASPRSIGTTPADHADRATPDKPGFRADVQGLRAVAVLVVIVFHADLPLSGGFVGVDMFFVVSGFVITAMLMREWDSTGRVSLRRFYIRRARRLTPALALMVGVTVVLSSLLLSPFDQQQLAAQTGLGALALVANWVIAAQTGDYFGASADANPLLHTWSLSVEEQFYLAFPITLLLAWRVGRRWVGSHTVALVVVCGLGLASLAMIRGAALSIPPDSWLIGYYSPLNRAWEFAAGAALALVVPNLPRSKVIATAAGVLGVLLVLVAITVINSETLFPGKWTLVPVVGTVLCIAAGSLHAENVVSRTLSTRAAVQFGDWSYSLYLWHWPLIVFSHALFPFSSWAAPVAAVLCFAPAVTSYRWVEVPLRHLRTHPLRRFMATMAAVVVGTAVLAAGSWAMALHVWKPAYESGALHAAHPVSPSEALLETRPSDPGFPCSWPELSAYIGENGMCRQSQKGTDPAVILLGDSHAEHLYPGLVESLVTQNVALMAVRAPYMFGSRAGLDLALDSILEGDQRPTVVISRSWTRGPLDREDQYEPLDHAVQRLTSAGLSVVLMDDVPDFPFPTSSCRYRIAPVIPHAICTQPRSRVVEARDAYLADLRRIAATHQGTEVVEVGLSLCDETACNMLSGGLLAYSDADHLNLVGSRVFGSKLADAADLGRPRTVP